MPRPRTSVSSAADSGRTPRRPEYLGSDTDRVVFEGQTDARYFIAGAFANPGPGTFGNAPRTIR